MLVAAVIVFLSMAVLASPQSGASLLSQEQDGRALSEWHDDCNTASGWRQETEGSAYDVEYAITGFGDLVAVDGSLVAASIPQPVDEPHGPLFVKSLPHSVPMSGVVQFSVDVGSDFYLSQEGHLHVYLFDEEGRRVTRSGVTRSHFLEHVHYHSDGREWAYGRWMDEGWEGEEVWWYDDVVGWPVLGVRYYSPVQTSTETQMSQIEYEQDRAISSIGIQFVHLDDRSYPDTKLKVYDIRLIYKTPEAPTKRCHIDCSNVSGFAFEDVAEALPWWSGRTTVLGEVHSDGSTLTFPGMQTEVDGWHGPLFVYDLAEPIPEYRVFRVSARLGIWREEYEACGVLEVYLCTAGYSPVYRFFVRQSEFPYLSPSYGLTYYTPSLEPFHHYGAGRNNVSLAAWRHPELGILSFVSYELNDFLVPPSALSSNREIMSIVIVPTSFEDRAWTTTEVDDIVIEYGVDPESTTTGGGTGTPLTLTLVGVATVTISVVSLCVIALSSFKILKHKRMTGSTTI